MLLQQTEFWTSKKNRFCSSINSQREFETHPKTAAFDDSNLLCFASNIFQHCNSATEKGVLMRTRGEDEFAATCTVLVLSLSSEESELFCP